MQAFEKPQIVYDTESIVNDCAFNPKFQRIAAACDKSLKIWDISSELNKPVVSIDVPKN